MNDGRDKEYILISKVRNSLLVVLLLVVTIGLLLVVFVKYQALNSEYKIVIRDDIVRLNPKHPLVQLFHFTEYQRFTNEYPEYWPQWLTLQENTYTASKGEIENRSAQDDKVSGTVKFAVLSIVMARHEDIVAYYSDLAYNSGINMEKLTSNSITEIQLIDPANTQVDVHISIEPLDNVNVDWSTTIVKVSLYLTSSSPSN